MNILADVLGSTIIFAVPLLLVALGGMYSERSGIVNIALEGIMIIGALISCLFLRAVDKSNWGDLHPQFAVLLAVLIAAASGLVYSLLLAFASIKLKADQTIGGTALNTLAPAFAIVLTWAIQGQGQTNIMIPTWVRITSITSESGFLARVFLKILTSRPPLRRFYWLSL
jgi:simple sugar transport system permease protein